ncbi:MAG: AMP-binding protein [Clostridiaceae bacterium]|nr:AMP-binding protein [Clostridiaceae bacterium]
MGATMPIYKIRPIRDLKDILEQSAKLFGSKNAFLVKSGIDGNYEGITYLKFKEDVEALGTALISLGLRDKFIAVIGENRYEWCVSYLAVVNGTGIVVPLDKELPASEIENLLTRSNASAVIFSGKFSELMKSLPGKLPTLKYYINMDASEDETPGSDVSETVFLSFRSLVEKGKSFLAAGDRSFIDAPVDAEKMSILLFTSGTTDKAKGVMLSHKNICFNMQSVCSVLYIDSTDSVLSILPLHHTYECTCGFLAMIYNGCTISFNEGLKHIAKNLQETKPSIIILVPLILENMYKKIWNQASKKPGLKIKLKAAIFISNFLLNAFKVDIRKKLFKQIHDNIGGNVRLIISGAAAINPEVSKGLRAFGFKVRQGYGLTECSPIVTVNHDEVFKDDSIGKPLPGVEVKIENLDENGIGEITVKGDNVMLGYFGDPEGTQNVLKDGWFYTGDLGTADNEGFFYITGRKKNVIVTKNGKNIYPEELEVCLNKSPYIFESLVWGKDEEDSDETIVCSKIVPDFEAIKTRLGTDNFTESDVRKIISEEIKAVNRNLPLFKRIRDFSIKEEEFAKTTTRKIKRYMENK